MQAKPVLLRAPADSDVDAAFEHYLTTAGAAVAIAFMAALADAYAHISRYPGTGSPRYGNQLGVPGLRSWPLNRYPYLVFYRDMPQVVEVIRVLHGAMDIPEWLA